MIQVFLLLKRVQLNEWLFMLWVLGGYSIVKVLVSTNLFAVIFSNVEG